MKRSLYLKFMLGYIIFFLAGYFSLVYIVEPNIYDNLVEEKGQTLYDTAKIAADYYLNENKFQELSDYNKISTELENFATLSNAELWVMNRSGEVLVSTSASYLPPTTIENLNLADYFKNGTYKIGNFYKQFDTPVLSAYANVAARSFSVPGYIVLHMPIEYIDASFEEYTASLYKLYYIISAISLIILIIFTIAVYFPLRKIIAASKAYAKGQLDYGTIKVKSRDEIGQLARDLEFMAGQLYDLEEYQHKFIANISHDFRSPLTSIKGYAEAILDGTIPLEMQEKYLKIVLLETERLIKLTSNLLTLNAWDNKGRKLILSNFDINVIIKNTLATFEGTCNKRKIVFDLTFNAKVYMVYADTSKIQQVLYNLIDNSFKFSPNNSSIDISVSDRYDKVFISIKDYGTGIPKESLNKIWERFYKSDQSRGKDKSGSGLGLSIVKEIIQSHEENIDVVSTEGVGTEFIFSLTKSKK